MFKKRLGVVLSTALAFYLIGTNLQAGWLYFLSFSLINLILIDLIFNLISKGELLIQREVPPLSQAGEKIKVKLKVKNPGKTKRLLVIEDNFLSGFKEAIFILKPNQEKQIEKEVVAKRGVYEGGKVSYHSAFPFHFFEFKKRVFVPSVLKVYPTFPYLTNFPLLEGGSFPKEVIHDWRKGSGTEFFGLREYRPGDSYRSIYWKKTAAVGQPVVKEFEKLVSTKTLLIVDNTASAYLTNNYSLDEIAQEAFEETIKAVASLAEYSIHCGHPVEMVWGENEELKYKQELSLKEVLEILAEIKLSENNFENFYNFLSTETVHQKTVIFFITPESSIDLNKLKLFQIARSRVFIFSQESHFQKENKIWEQKLARLEQSNFFICRHQKGEVSQCLQERWRPIVELADLRK